MFSYERKIEELENRLKQTDLSADDRQKTENDLAELKRQEEEYNRKEEELERQEKLEKWNVDTISHDGFSKSRINKLEKAKQKELTDEEKEEQMVIN